MSNSKRIFYPDQPVPPDLFVGRADAIRTLKENGLAPVLDGDPTAVFVLGEFGMGKSSIAHYLQSVAMTEHGVCSIYANLAGATSLTDLARAVYAAADDTWAANATNETLITNATPRKKFASSSSPRISRPKLQNQPRPPAESATHIAMLKFLKSLRDSLPSGHDRAILVVLDEIDSIATEKPFAQFIKGLVDTNAQDAHGVSLLLVVCGVRRSWQQLLEGHPSVERVFEQVEILPMTFEEVTDFYKTSFAKASISISMDAIKIFHSLSAGIPRIMQIVGEKAYKADTGRYITLRNAQIAVARAAATYGEMTIRETLSEILLMRESTRKGIHEEKAILVKIGALDDQGARFLIGDIVPQLSSPERMILFQFLDDLVRLRILRHGETRDEFEFSVPLVHLYLSLAARGELSL